MRFPLEAETCDLADRPQGIGIFDSYGYWASSNLGHITLPEDALPLGRKIAALANAAYEQGQEDAKRAMREALGLPDE